MNYTVDYFIAKFEAIPEENWCTGLLTQGDRHCAAGHCRLNSIEDMNQEALALIELLRTVANNKKILKYPVVYIYAINDNSKIGLFEDIKGETPKERIIDILYRIKGNQAVRECETILTEVPLIHTNHEINESK